MQYRPKLTKYMLWFTTFNTDGGGYPQSSGAAMYGGNTGAAR